MKTFAWAIIKVLKIGRKSIIALVSEVELSEDEEKNIVPKYPSLIGEKIRFGCKGMSRCTISRVVDASKYPVLFEKPVNENKVPFIVDMEYGVLLTGNLSKTNESPRIIKGSTKRDLYNVLGRAQEEVQTGLRPAIPRTTRRRAI